MTAITVTLERFYIVHILKNTLNPSLGWKPWVQHLVWKERGEEGGGQGQELGGHHDSRLVQGCLYMMVPSIKQNETILLLRAKTRYK